ncbi:MAG: heavy metal translocating P-type ATPase [Rubripirellula sp.]
MSTAEMKTEECHTRVACAHCGLPAPPPKVDGEPSFCCRGCQGAYDLIRGWGLEEFYELRDSPSEVPEDESREFEDLDDPTLLGKSAPMILTSEAGDPLLKSTLAISGLHCAACIWLIERAPEQIAGWQSARVNMHARSIQLVFDPTRIKLSEIARFLNRVGYRVTPLGDPTERDPQLDEGRRLLIQVAIAGFCAANAMWIAIALYAGQFSGIAASHEMFLRFAGVALGCAAVVFPGRIFFRSAWASIRTRTPHMDLPVAVGLSAGMMASLYALLDSTRDVYFDSIACLVFFLLTGRWLQMRQQRRAGEAVAELMRMSPTIATRVDEEGKERRMPVAELVIGDRVRVQPGESVPVDGTIEVGESTVDRSLLTGESCPVSVSPGSRVEAGTDNTRSPLTIRVTALGEETRLSQMQQAVELAAESRTPVVQLANRIGAWFVVVVLALALVTALAWWWIDPSRMVGNVVALLIVACPCALALATPLAIAVAIGRLAKQSVLVRAGDCLERLTKPGTVFFDKTGTLTEGRMRVTHWTGTPDALREVAMIESHVSHPIARALVDYFEALNPNDVATPLLAGRESIEVEHRVGRGVLAEVDGQKYEIGSTRLLSENASCETMKESIAPMVADGASPILVVRDGQCVAAFGVMDSIRPEAADVVKTLQSEGWRVEIISGDHHSSVQKVGRTLGLGKELSHGDLLPEDKLVAIQGAAARGPVLMVGDGVNDAAALAAADVGIAVRGGASASLAAAPVVIGGRSLQGVLDLVDSASRTRRTIARNFAISISYNVLAVGLAMAGWITPLIAAALMPASSLTVLGLTLAPISPKVKS